MNSTAMGRRAVLRLFGGAAVMGRGAAKAATDAVMGQSATLGVIGTAAGQAMPTAECGPAFSPVDLLLRRFVRDISHAAEIEQEVEHRVARNELPPSVGGKRSWSPTFKAHVFRAKRMAEGQSWRLHDRIDSMTEIEKAALVARLKI